jgi:phage repressor protein C with HTH and peptisase S24 domain
VSKVLDATHCSLGNFVALFGGTGDGVVQRIPIIGYAEAGRGGYFDDAGYPVATGWDEVLFPDIGDANAFALEISGSSMEPVYRDGDTIIVSPTADIRRGDRIVLKTAKGEIMAKELTRKTARKLELGSMNASHPTISLNIDDIVWMSRIVWVNQ